MTKVLIDKYPLGTLPNQKTAGRYIDDILKANLDVLAEKIVDDLQFLGICSSSTYEVRSGKSTFLQQIGEYYTDSINRQHKLNLKFDMNNIVFNSEDLITRAFKLPKYSVLIMDENDEVDEHYFSKLSKNLRKFFKKSGQLNLFILMIVPNFFELKKGYAVSRSNFLIDVRFEGKFERGYFRFYSFDRKRELYVRGKKTNDYNVVKADFTGRFVGGYAVDRDKYLKGKLDDLKKHEEAEKPAKETLKEYQTRVVNNIIEKFKGRVPVEELAEALGVDRSTAYRRIAKEKQVLVAVATAEL